MRDHTVQLYQEEEELSAALARFAGAGLALGQGVVFMGNTVRWQATLERLRGAGVDTHNAVLRGQLRLFSAKVAQARTLGLRIVAWTVNEPDAIRHVLGLELDGIISDYPDRVRALLK